MNEDQELDGNANTVTLEFLHPARDPAEVVEVMAATGIEARAIWKADEVVETMVDGTKVRRGESGWSYYVSGRNMRPRKIADGENNLLMLLSRLERNSAAVVALTKTWDVQIRLTVLNRSLNEHTKLSPLTMRRITALNITLAVWSD